MRKFLQLRQMFRQLLALHQYLVTAQSRRSMHLMELYQVDSSSYNKITMQGWPTVFEKALAETHRGACMGLSGSKNELATSRRLFCKSKSCRRCLWRVNSNERREQIRPPIFINFGHNKWGPSAEFLLFSVIRNRDKCKNPPFNCNSSQHPSRKLFVGSCENEMVRDYASRTD